MARIAPSWLVSNSRRLILLAPEAEFVPKVFNSAVCDQNSYEDLLAGMQRLRGTAYLEDGAIQAHDLTGDGRHISPADRKAWHVIAVDAKGDPCGCARYLEHNNDVPFSGLVIERSALARDPKFSGQLRSAVEGEIALARRKGVAYAEVGGWALDRSTRCTSEALRIALATYALSRNLGGCIGISTVTVRHCSSAILQKIGGSMLEFAGAPLPMYYDPQYRCDMAMLRFQADQPNPRYENWIEGLRAHLRNVTVVCRLNAPVWEPNQQALLACA